MRQPPKHFHRNRTSRRKTKSGATQVTVLKTKEIEAIGNQLSNFGWSVFNWDSEIPFLRGALNERNLQDSSWVQEISRLRIKGQQLRPQNKLFRVVQCAARTAGYSRPKLKQARLQRSTHAHETEKVPFVPHIDRDRYLKLMIYLSDVDLSSGPLSIAKQSPAQLEQKRLCFDHTSKKHGLNIVDSIPCEPVLGPARTVILFDTNTPHHAISPEETKSRLVIRFDFNCGWQKTSNK